MVTCWERADILCMMFLCGVFVTFPFGVSDLVLHLIVLIPDLCLLLYFYNHIVCYVKNVCIKLMLVIY